MVPPNQDKPKRIPPNAGKGRKKGSLNKTTRAVREMAAAMIGRSSYRKSLEKRLDSGKAPHMEVLYHHYAHGKPKETVRHEDAPATLQVISLRNRADIQMIKGAFDADATIDDQDDDE